ncbi:MAG: 30S ribosomal protein S16 [Parachlamydiaceae bacterium]|nr:30S ribosomal protein S16 [Parachlamydiaceae bacterium]
MALTIRLRQQGRKNHTVYRVVVMDSRARRDGKYIESVGWYNPLEALSERNLFILPDRIQHWVGLGAQMSENVAQLVRQSAPSIVREMTERTLAHKAKARAKRKARKSAAA